jgi:hypothetical protein
VDFLGLTKKHRDMNGIISYTLTQKGERVAKNLRSLYLSIDEILPKED